MEQPDHEMPTQPEPHAPPPPDAVAEDDLATVHGLILLAYQDLVPELVRGATIAELRAAVEPARAAYRQVAERISATPPAAPPSVPAGAAGAVLPLDGLPPGELIRRALQGR